MDIVRTASAFSPVIVGSALLVGISPVWARDYFDPALLSMGSDQEVITDLSAFETAGKTPPGIYLVTVVVNQDDRGQHQIIFTSDDKDRVQPQLTPEFLAEMGVNTQALQTFSSLAANQPIGDLSTLIPDARTQFDFQQ